MTLTAQTGAASSQANASRVQCLKRQLDTRLSPVEAYGLLTGDGTQANTLLLETADGLAPDTDKSLALLSAALRIEARGPELRLQALNRNGERLLAALETLPACLQLQQRRADMLLLQFVAAPAPADERERLQMPTPMTVIRSVLQGFVISPRDDQALLMAAGVFSFESVEMAEQFAPFAVAKALPDFTLIVPDLVLLQPRSGRSATLAALVFADDEHSRGANEASRKLASVAAQLEQAQPSVFVARTGDTAQAQAEINDADFHRFVERARQHLLAGDVFQLVLSRRFLLPCTRPFAAYRTLRDSNPSPYLFYLSAGDQVLFGASPESAVKVDGATRVVQVSPIAGTRPRGRDASDRIDSDLDSRLEAELRTDEKEIAEHMMLVDLARNDVARLSETGTREVSQLLSVERYARVMHLVSRVRGRLRAPLDALHAFSAAMPMGTLSGAPKIRAIELIRAIEGKPRGAYGGAIGYVNAAGDMDTAIVIRAASVRDGVAAVQAGAGLVLGSDPQAEADETRRKAEAVLRAIAGAERHGSGNDQRNGGEG